MASTSTPDYARERRLIEQLEFRIAGADSSEKLQNILQKFLPALLLKLGSTDIANRNLTIKVCQYINQRLKIDQSIQLPVAALTKTFQESQSAFVRQFSLLFVQQGLDRIAYQDGVTALPALLRSSARIQDDDLNDARMFGVCMDFLLRMLRDWKAPVHGSEEDAALKDEYQLSPEQTKTIAEQLSLFLLYDPKTTTSYINEDMRTIFGKHFTARSAIVPNLADFLFTSIFSDSDRFVPATILSADANATASNRADTMFKQCSFDLESDEFIDMLFGLYPRAKPRLKTRVLNLLSRSKASTNRVETIAEMIETQLNAPALNLEESKLQSAMFTYLTWTVRLGENTHLVANRLQASLKEFIEVQGWPVPHRPSIQDTDLRAKAYESIGLLSASTSSAHEDARIDLISWLFASLRCDTSRDAKNSIEESLSRLLASTVVTGAENLQKLKEILLWNILAKEGDEDPIYYLPTRNISSYPAVRFTNKVLPLDDVDARAINIFALMSDKREVVEEAHRGLDPSWHFANLRIAGAQQESIPKLPKFNDFARKIFEQTAEMTSRAQLSQSASAMAGLVRFSQNLIAVQAWTSSRFSIDLDDQDWLARIDRTLSNEQEARDRYRDYLAEQPKNLVVQLLQTCYLGMAAGSLECGEVGLQLTSLASNSVLDDLGDDSLMKLEVASRVSSVRNQACRIVGMVFSVRSDWADGLMPGFSALSGWQTAVGQQLVAVEVLLLKSAYVLSRAALRGSTDKINQLSIAMFELCLQILEKSVDKSLRQVAYTAVGQLALCLPRTFEKTASIDELLGKMLTEAKKESEVAVNSLGRLLTLSWDHFGPDRRSEILQKLYELHEVRKAEFQFALGESFAVAALGFDSSSTITEFDVDAVRPIKQTRTDLFGELFDDFLRKSASTKPALRKANGIWLLSLIQFCTASDLLKPRLRESQAAFSRLLSDRDELVQETGSRGLGIVYEKGDKSLREDLVRDLVQSFTGSNARSAGTVTEATQLFEPGALPTENGQSVTTYKDIISLAQEMGDPSLVYRFMNLASNNAIWTSRAAFGRFGLSEVLSDSTYLQENKKFYPKLFRYRFDPNPNVQRSMDDIWKALVKDPNAIIEANFDLIMEDLLKSIVYGREWRAREASCAAISDLVQGREIEKFEKYLDEIWKVAFKVLDDVKETVRVAAMKLCRTLTGMLIRNLEVGEGTSKRATTMLKHAMPFLLQQMDAGAGREVQQYAIVTLLDVVKKAPPRSLRGYAPVILETLINSLSSLEHESINYLHLNADKYGLTAEKLDNMRVSSVGASPVSEAIERCIDSLSTIGIRTKDLEGAEIDEIDPVADAMKRLESSFKVAIGLPSRVGLSRAMITLVVRHHAMFRPFADRFVKLTRKSILDRNATISQSFSTALAYLVRLASGKEVRQTIAYAKKLYFESQETSHRAVAGEMVQAISKASNDVFANFAASFLPFAFVGRQDLDEDTRERFETTWKDNVGGSRALQLYLREIVDLVRKHIESTVWPIRHACCFAVSDLVSSVDVEQKYSKEDASLLWPLVDQSLSGRTWEGKEKVVAAFPRFVKNASTIWPENGKQMRSIAIREAKRKNDSYRPHALKALGEFARIWSEVDMSGEVIPFLVEIVDTALDADAMEIDPKSANNTHSRYVVLGVLHMTDESSSESLVTEQLCSAITCLFAVLRRSSTSEVLDQALITVKKLHCLRLGAIEVSLYQGAKDFVEQREAEVDAPDSTPEASPNPAERFLHEVVLALLEFDPQFSRGSQASESLGLKRVQLAATTLRSKAASPGTRETLARTLAFWLEHESSPQTRLLIQQALERKTTAAA